MVVVLLGVFGLVVVLYIVGGMFSFDFVGLVIFYICVGFGGEFLLEV